MVIITGTPSGTAWSTDAELGGRWSGTDGMVPAKGYLQDGDHVVCEIDCIGRLENVVRESRCGPAGMGLPKPSLLMCAQEFSDTRASLVFGSALGSRKKLDQP